jgi:RNA polymerase sigma-70 factor (ECF subfamily)
MTIQPSTVPSNLPEELALITAAVGGDRVALERLLLAEYDALAQRIGTKLPPRLQATHAVEDILQLAFFQAFRDIAQFQHRADASFGNWLAKIAENRLCDVIKEHDRAKRGGDMQRVEDAAGSDSSILSLWDWIAAADTSPGSIMARDEALNALQAALAALPAEQRAAIQLRFLEGKSLEETAAAMQRTPDAIRGLVHRGKEQLLAAMGRASKWLKSK